jgi:hypothetical protein
MDQERLPPQLRTLMSALSSTLRMREPAIRERVERLRAANPGLAPDQLSRKLISDTRFRVATTGAVSGAAAIAPGIGTLIALGTVTSQAVYALEQETELVLGIAMIHGHELASSDQRLLEALVVVGIAGGGVKLRENLLVAGGERITLAAFRRLPQGFLGRGGGHVLARILGRVAGGHALSSFGRLAPLAVGMAVGAAFDWVSVSALGRAAIRYYSHSAVAAPPPPARFA